MQKNKKIKKQEWSQLDLQYHQHDVALSQE